jgi:hypothetical protein
MNYRPSHAGALCPPLLSLLVVFDTLEWHHESVGNKLKDDFERAHNFLTFGRTNNALNLEKTRNISLAFLAVPSLSRSRAII